MPIVRQKLTIKEVHEPKSFGTKGGQKVEFVCDGKKWVTFKKALFPYIVVGEIDADTEVKERKVDDTTYVDRIVGQIYVDGKAIEQSKPYQYQTKGYSPEERASIEAQQAAKFTTELWIAGKLDNDSPEVKGLRMWLLLRLNAEKPQKSIEPSKTKPSTKAETEPKVAESGEVTLATPGEPSKEHSNPVSSLNRDPMTIKNYTQLCKACNEDWAMQPKDVLKELGVSLQSDITQTMPDCYITIAAVREVPKEQE